jgi:hypothetical protein
VAYCKGNHPDEVVKPDVTKFSGRGQMGGYWRSLGVARPDRALPMEALRVERMANGWSSLLLTEQVAWEDFPAYAEAIAPLIGARLGQRVDGPDIRMRSLRLGLRWYWIMFDDFPLGVTIEPRHARASRRIQAIYNALAAGSADD